MKLVAALFALLAFASGARGETDYAATGPLAVRTADVTWTDAARQRDVPLRLRLPETQERVPTILFSHGLGGSRAGGAEWGAHWASHGFAVIHLQHPGSDESLWRDKPVGERLAGLRSGISLQQFMARLADARFVLDELARRRAAGDPLVASLDLDRLGMSGHSFGAVTTLYLGGQQPAIGGAALGDLEDKRFAAFLAFSPQATAGFDPRVQFARFTRPALLVTGTRDGQPFPGLGATAEQRLIPFEAMPANGNKFELVVEDADHMYFNGTRGLRDIGAGDDGIDFAAVEARGYPQVKAVSTAYWFAFLRDDRQAGDWLRRNGGVRAK